MRKQLDQFRAYFSELGFWKKIGRFATKVGVKGVYTALLLYYAYRRKETPAWAKRIVLGALGYLVVPLDFIPDLSPFVGLTDDLGVLSFGLVTIAAFVNKEVREKARAKTAKFFPAASDEDFESVEEQL